MAYLLRLLLQALPYSYPPMAKDHSINAAIHILVLDDEDSIRWIFERTLSEMGYTVHTASSAEEAARLIAKQPVQLALVDINLPGDDGLTFTKNQLAKQPELLVAIVTGQGGMDNAVQAMKLGAFDYLTKPFDIQEVERLVERAATAIRAQGKQGSIIHPIAAGGEEMIVGRTRQAHEVFKAIGRVAATDLNVLILGESGTGKELIAKAIHQHSGRSGEPFVAVNCAAIPKDLLESELFGHERGAFSGAVERKSGRIEAARGGTLFLDEIGDLPLELQAKLLRVLQEREYQRVGGMETLRMRARLISATNQTLGDRVQEGRFRDDLYYRINTFTIQSFPLRERTDDIPLLVDHFISRASRELSLPRKMVSAEAMARLCAYPWPGNIRELENVIKSLMILSAGHVIDEGDLPRNILGAKREGSLESEMEEAVLRILGSTIRDYCQEGKTGLMELALALLERPLIRQVMMEKGGNQLKAAEVLGINRNTLRTRLETLNIRKP